MKNIQTETHGEKMKLSVIVPIYNVEKYLRRCIESIINQTYRDLEIILVNDGSPDSCGEICQEYAKKDNRIVYVEKENGGLVSAYTFGFNYVTSEYVTFVDSDDWIDLEMYECMMSYIQKNYDLVVCSYFREGKNRSVKVNFGCDEGEVSLNNFYYCLNKHKISASRCIKIFNTKILSRVLNNLDKQVAFAEDLMVSLPVAKLSKKIYFLDKPFYHYNFTDNSISNKIRLNLENDINKIYKVLKKYDFTSQEMNFINESMVELYGRYFNLLINSGLEKKVKLQNIERVMNMSEYQYLIQNCDWECYSRKQEKLKKQLKNKKNQLKPYRHAICIAKIKIFAYKTGLIKIYKKIRDRRS